MGNRGPIPARPQAAPLISGIRCCLTIWSPHTNVWKILFTTYWWSLFGWNLVFGCRCIFRIFCVWIWSIPGFLRGCRCRIVALCRLLVLLVRSFLLLVLLFVHWVKLCMLLLVCFQLLLPGRLFVQVLLGRRLVVSMCRLLRILRLSLVLRLGIVLFLRVRHRGRVCPGRLWIFGDDPLGSGHTK
jgi:hypothetical protein